MSSLEGNPVQSHPFIYWAQSRTHVWLKVDLKDVKNPDIHVNENCVRFSATGLGARGHLLYEFELQLRSHIDPQGSQYRVTARQIDISLRKETEGWWNRLTASKKKLNWLKIDFDKWPASLSEDEAGRDDGEPSSSADGGGAPHATSRLPAVDLARLKKIYLLVYNVWQLLGFLYIVGLLSIDYLRHGPAAFLTTYQRVGNALKFCQLMQILEILHPLFGYTKGGLMEAVLQVGARFTILFGLIEAEPRVQPMPVIFYLFYVWSLVELFRYPYYIARVCEKEIGLITWLRYTVWIPLYPLGFLCEGVVILRNIPLFEETGKFSVSLPNAWNFSFHYPTLMRVYLLFFFLPAMYTMMSYMQRQRKAKLQHKKTL